MAKRKAAPPEEDSEEEEFVDEDLMGSEDDDDEEAAAGGGRDFDEEEDDDEELEAEMAALESVRKERGMDPRRQAPHQQRGRTRRIHPRYVPSARRRSPAPIQIPPPTR
jgi:hypothetical protein